MGMGRPSEFNPQFNRSRNTSLVSAIDLDSSFPEFRQRMNQGSISTPGFSTAWGSSVRLVARNALANSSGLCRSYHGR